MANERYQHVFLNKHPQSSNYTSPSTFGSEKRIPSRVRQQHSDFLSKKFQSAWAEAEEEKAVAHADREGVYVEFKGAPAMDLVTQSLEDIRAKVRLLNVRREIEDGQEVVYATVFIPNSKRKIFLKKIEEYATKQTDSGRPRHDELMRSISDIRKALLIGSFWQDKKELIPLDAPIWCEIWLSGHSDETLNRFQKLLNDKKIVSAEGAIKFPERMVKVVYANKQTLEMLTANSDDIAEYRKAKEIANYWINADNKEQAGWVKELLARLSMIEGTDTVICVLDTGVNNGHPLLAPLLEDQKCQTIQPAWGTSDEFGHGTQMAGLAAYGDLQRCLETMGRVQLRHRLESVKIIEKNRADGDSHMYGYNTSQAVSRAETESPKERRIICLAISTPDERDRGRPSSWSGTIDKLSSGAEDNQKRLFILSAGNCDIKTKYLPYPDIQITDGVHDPGQAWNALTVGAYTQLVDIKDVTLKGYTALAPVDGLSPFTTTSSTWEQKWPIKPEILMEGGNVGHDGAGFTTECSDLSLLTTHHKPTTQHFDYCNMTSAATAKASWFAAQIASLYPNIWPETIRALMVHSAEWPEALITQCRGPQTSKTAHANMLKICGYGIPVLERALFSAKNSLTLIAQEELQPFEKSRGRLGTSQYYKSKEMHLYKLPWPKEALLGLPSQTKLKMRVTLSYFVEPGPGEIGWKDRYRYQSYALRFGVKLPTDTDEIFMKKINAAVLEEEEDRPSNDGGIPWVIGPVGRNKGSIHSDIWEGTAADLAASGVIAVYPVTGWWKQRTHLNRWSKKCRYSLIVSLHTPEQNIDIYTPVAIEIGIKTPVEIQI